MLRKRAIRSLLVEEVAGLKLATSADRHGEGAADETDRAESPAPEEIAERAREDQLAALERAEKKALFMIGLDWLALVALFLLREPAAPFLPTGPTVDTVFTLGVILVAVHSGYRLGQLEKYRAVRRAWDDLAD